MKRILVLGIVLALLLCLVSCGGKEEETTDTSADTDVTDTTQPNGESGSNEQTEAEETFSPDLNLTEIDRFD